jgi:hypothetical protein
MPQPENMIQQTSNDHVGGRQPYGVKTKRDLCMCGWVWGILRRRALPCLDLACTLTYLLFLSCKKCFRNAGYLSRYQMLFT